MVHICYTHPNCVHRFFFRFENFLCGKGISTRRRRREKKNTNTNATGVALSSQIIYCTRGALFFRSLIVRCRRGRLLLLFNATLFCILSKMVNRISNLASTASTASTAFDIGQTHSTHHTHSHMHAPVSQPTNQPAIQEIDIRNTCVDVSSAKRSFYHCLLLRMPASRFDFIITRQYSLRVCDSGNGGITSKYTPYEWCIHVNLWCLPGTFCITFRLYYWICRKKKRSTCIRNDELYRFILARRGSNLNVLWHFVCVCTCFIRRRWRVWIWRALAIGAKLIINYEWW